MQCWYFLVLLFSFITKDLSEIGMTVIVINFKLSVVLDCCDPLLGTNEGGNVF